MTNVIGGKNIIDGLNYLYKTGNKKYSEFPLGRKKVIVLFSPEYIHELFVNKSKDFDRGITFTNMKKLFRTGILVSNDPEHFHKKKIMKPLFYKEKINKSCSDVYHIVENLLKEKNEKIDLTDISRKTSFYSVSESFFGENFSKKHIEILLNSGEKIVNNKILDLSEEDLKEAEIIRNDVKESIKKNKPNTLISLMNDSGMSQEEIVDQVLTILGAGFDTTSDLILWSLCYISQNKDILEEIKKQKFSWIDEKRSPTIEEISNNDIINKIIKETLRIKPPGYLTSRVANKDTNILDINVSEGMQIFVSPYITHNIEEYYKNSNMWNPKRWSDEFEKSLPRGAYLPFLYGRTRCIGDQFAKMVAYIFIAMFIKKYNFSIDEFPEENFLISVSPKKNVWACVSPVI